MTAIITELQRLMPSASKLPENLIFTYLEDALQLIVPTELKDYIGSYCHEDMTVDWQGQPVDLFFLKVEEDWHALQENWIGHVLMLRRLKLNDTLFFGIHRESEEMIVIQLSDGQVYSQVPGQACQQCLANDLASFLANCQKDV